MDPVICVVGIGADGWEGLPRGSRVLIEGADVVVGGQRHLAMLPAMDAVLEGWPSPLLERLPALVEKYAGQRLVVLASGDPLLSGIGSNLVALLGSEHVEVVPAVSSVAWARARMRWSAESTDVVSLVGRDVDDVRRLLSPGRRLVVLSSDGQTPAEVARVLVESGFAQSMLTVLSDLGARQEQRIERTATGWLAVDAPPLNVVCVECRRGDTQTALLPTVPGLPDAAFEHDGQLTKRDLRASALARLSPFPGQLLWDVGAGAGSVAIEWMRTDPRCRAVAIEADQDRAARITRNAGRLGVPSLEVHHASAPEGLAGLPAPDAVFVGGGACEPGVHDACWEALRPGGRLLVHAVTLETEETVIAHYRRLGGELTRLSIERATPIGSFTGWTPARAIVQWAVTKEDRP